MRIVLLTHRSQQKHLKEALERGRTIEAYNNKIVSKSAKRACWKRFLGHNVLALNCTHLVNEVGNEIALREGCDFAVLWNYDHFKGAYQVCLRGEGKVDLSAIAKQFGGGGHPKASAFRTNKHIEELFEPIEDSSLFSTVRYNNNNNNKTS